MNVLLTTIVAILIFAVLIFIHEFGHFIAAKLSGVKVNEFALGMGPKLFSRQNGETLYSVRLIPIGGFCAMEGEDEQNDDERAFSNKKPYIRFFILIAGALMNVLLGFILIFSLALGSAETVVPEVKDVTPDGTAETAGLKNGDVIIRVNGKRVHIIEDMSWAMSNNTNENRELQLVVENDGERRAVSVEPQTVDGKSSYGILLQTESNSVFSAFRNSWYKTGFYSRVIIESFIDIIKGDIPISQMSGPVGIVSEIGSVVEEARTTGREGIYSLLYLTVLLTINLGIFNLFPIPALDGGRILFVLIEMIRRKPVPTDKEAIVHFAGFVILIAFSIVIAFKDVFTLWG